MPGFFEMPPSWQKHWQGMPSFNQRDLSPHQSVTVHFRNPEDRQVFADLIEQRITHKTRSIWHPKNTNISEVNKLFMAEEVMNPKYPIYIISKGRWESRLTSRALERMNVPYRIVVEPQERDEYAAVIDPSKILVLPFSNLGQGSIPARNWVWEHSVSEGHSRHWILDDNIRRFLRVWNNVKTPVGVGNIFRAAEDFTDRYENVGLSGFQYYMFVARKQLCGPFILNTRIYSCILIKNDLYPEGERWRGRYNEDTDLSLRVLKDGWCTVLFNAFLCHKTPTMTMKGGNTDELYRQDEEFDGRWEMSESLRLQHPDVVTTTQKWGRWQHQVDYSRFKRNKLKLKPNARISSTPNEYEMYLKMVSPDDGFLESDDKLLLVGQAPGRNGDPNEPLGGRIGSRLAKLAGISYDRYMEETDRVNLFEEWPGKDGKGDAWDEKEAVVRAEVLKPWLRNRRVLFVGRNVARAFGCNDLDWLQWVDDDTAEQVAVIPHPSGIVTWWNDKGNRDSAGRFLSEAFRKMKDS